jgi:putative zinc finger/helix-turn-helix YgiT family protein
MTSSRETVKYNASGLSGVTLRSLEVRRCNGCGDYELVIPKIEQLHRLIAHTIIRKQASLVGEEVRFLRKYLGWSGADFAAHMGAKPETVSRWENGKLTMSPQADRLLRIMVAMGEPEKGYSLEALKTILPKKAARPLRAFRHGQRGWKEDHAA